VIADIARDRNFKDAARYSLSLSIKKYCRSASLRSGLRQQGFGLPAVPSPALISRSLCSLETVPGHYQPRLTALEM
jgi:hypothetical protein